jgi:hypothetical protein
MNVGSGGNHPFRGANRNPTLIHPFRGFNITSRDFVPDGNAFSKDHFMAVDHIPIARVYWRDHNEHVIVAMDSQQLS